MNPLVAEQSTTKIASIFATESAALDAATSVVASVGLRRGQVRVLAPADGERSHNDLFGRKVQPESRGIARTFVRSHLVLGALGGAAGVIAWWALQGSALGGAAPIAALVALGGLGITFGLLAAALLTLRPDQSVLFARLKDSLRQGHWGVIFHPVSRDQTQAIRTALRACDAQVLSTL